MSQCNTKEKYIKMFRKSTDDVEIKDILLEKFNSLNLSDISLLFMNTEYVPLDSDLPLLGLSSLISKGRVEERSCVNCDFNIEMGEDFNDECDHDANWHVQNTSADFCCKYWE